MSERKTGSKTDSKTESAQPADLFAQWNEGWRAMAAASGTVNDTWSKSILPFMLARATENKSGFGAGNELAEAIERMTQGPPPRRRGGFRPQADRHLRGVDGDAKQACGVQRCCCAPVDAGRGKIQAE